MEELSLQEGIIAGDSDESAKASARTKVEELKGKIAIEDKKFENWKVRANANSNSTAREVYHYVWSERAFSLCFVVVAE